MMVAMLTLAIFATVFASTNAQASLATYEKGDKFALKGEKDMKFGYYSANQLITFGDKDHDWIRDATVDNASLSCYMSSVMIFEVIEVTADEYVMKITAAQNISLDAQLLLTGEMVSPGKYISDWNDRYSTNPDGLLNLSEAEAAVGTYGFDARTVVGANETFIVHLQKSNMAIKSMEVAASVYARGNYRVLNQPNITNEDDSGNYLSIMNITSYDSFSGTITLDLYLSGQMSFDPSIGAVRDGPAEDSTWEVDTYTNGTFSWTGMLDVTGLPDSIISGLFDEDAAGQGITGFPIDLAKIYSASDSEPRIDNGTMAISAQPASFEFCNLGNTVVNDPFYGNITIYRMGFNNATQNNPVEVWYYPAEGSLVGFEMTYPLYGMGKLFLDMKSVSVDEAERSISSISEQIEGKKNYEQVNSAAAINDGPSDELMGLLPIIALIAVAVIAVVGIVFVMRRRSKPKA